MLCSSVIPLGIQTVNILKAIFVTLQWVKWMNIISFSSIMETKRPTVSSGNFKDLQVMNLVTLI